MQRREAASAAGSGPRARQATDARYSYCAGDGVRTMWTPQIGSIVFKARALLEIPQNNNNTNINNNPLGALARLVRRFGAAGPARAARRVTTPRATGGEKGAAASAAGAGGFRRRLGSASENISGILAKDGLSGVRGHNFYPDHSAHINGPCKGKGKGRGRGSGAQGREGGGGGGAGCAGASGGGSSKRRKLRHSNAFDSSAGAPIEPGWDYIWSGSEYLTPPEDPGAVAEALVDARENRVIEARERAMEAGVPYLSGQSVSGIYAVRYCCT